MPPGYPALFSAKRAKLVNVGLLLYVNNLKVHTRKLEPITSINEFTTSSIHLDTVLQGGKWLIIQYLITGFSFGCNIHTLTTHYVNEYLYSLRKWSLTKNVREIKLECSKRNFKSIFGCKLRHVLIPFQFYSWSNCSNFQIFS